MKAIRCAKGLSRGLAWLVPLALLLALVLAANGSSVAQASPGPDSITDSFTDEAMIASKVNLAVEGGQVQLDEVFPSGLYGGDKDDYFYAVYADSNYVYAAGFTDSEGAGGQDAVLVKFNIGDLSIASRKVYGGDSHECFYSVYADGSYVYAVGYTNSTGAGGWDALLVKFNNDLSVDSGRVYGGKDNDCFYSVYADIDYVYAAGYTRSEGEGDRDALLVQFNKGDLTIRCGKIVGWTGFDCFYSVYADSSYVYAAGVKQSGWTGGLDALLFKFGISDPPNMGMKTYDGADYDCFYSVYADGSYVYAAGETHSGAAGPSDALLVKFDAKFNILCKKVYGGGGADCFYSVYADGSYVYAAGETWSEGMGARDALLVKFNIDDLSFDSGKVHGGGSADCFQSVYADGSHVYAAGSTNSTGEGGCDAWLVKVDIALAAGTAPDSCGLVCQDSASTLAGSNLTSFSSPVAIDNDPSLFLAAGTLTLGPSALIAATCFSSGTLSSTNLLSGQDVASIDSFGYSAFSIPPGTGLKVRFSQDNTSWYSSGGTLGGWDTCAEGSNSIDLSSLGWSGPDFYYKMQLTSDGSSTPVLDEISVTYSTAPSPPRVPAANQWGIVAMITLFAGLLVMKSVQHRRAGIAKQSAILLRSKLP